MATIFPPFRSLTARSALLWTANNTVLGGAVIDGFAANFAGIGGGEQVTISRFGSPPTLITLLPGDNSLVNVIARINATFPGLASANVNGGVRLIDATSVGVTVISGPDQALIGLPAAVFRDASAGFQPSVQPDLTMLFDRIDMISKGVSLPDGANRVAAWLKVLGNDATNVGTQFTLGFTNGVEGVPVASVLDAVLLSDLLPYAQASFGPVYMPKVQNVYAGTFAPGAASEFVVEADIPPGAQEVFIILTGAEDPASGNRAYSPPTISGGVIPGVR